MVIKRGAIFFADLSPSIGSEQGGIRPVVIIQNDIGNRYSPTTIVAAISSNINRAKLPTHVEISADEYGLNKNGVILLEQVRTLDRKRLMECIGQLTLEDMTKVNTALNVTLDLPRSSNNNNTSENDITNQEIKEINEAISILKGIAIKYNIKEYNDKKSMEDKYKNISDEMWKAFENMSAEFNGLTEEFKGINTKINPLVEKQKRAKGMLLEQAVIDYFKSNNYYAEKADNNLDSLQIDVIAKDDFNVIFTQVKSGQISVREIVNLVENIINLDNIYCEEGFNRVACVCADRFPTNGEIFRIKLEKEFNIKIMFIQKYQILEKCPQYKCTVQ